MRNKLSGIVVSILIIAALLIMPSLAFASMAPAAPNAPAVLSVTSDSATIYWNAVANATGYELYQGGVLVYDGPNTSTIISRLAPGTTYSFTVRAYNSFGTSPHGPIGAVTTQPAIPQAPGAPVATNITNYSVTFSWSPVAGATEYELYRGGTRVFSGAVTSITITGLAANTTYSFTLRAISIAGASPFSPACTVTTLAFSLSAPPPLMAPKAFNITSNSATV